MVPARHYSKRSGSRHRRSNYAAPSSSSHSYHGSSKISSWPSSSRGRGRGRTRHCSVDSLYSRDSSYERLLRPSKYLDMSGRHHRPPHYDRMVCEAVARLKSRKGSSIKDIAKNLENKYPHILKGKGKGTAEKVIATARRLVKEGRLVKDGSHYRLSKTSSRRSEDSQDKYYDDDDAASSHGQTGGKHSYSHRSGTRGGSSRKRSRSPSNSPSRSRSRSSRPRSSRKRQTTSYRKRKRGSKRAHKTSTRGRGRASKRGTKRKKGGRKGQTRLATGKRGPYQKKASRARRRVKHSHSKRPKSDKLPDQGESSQANTPHSSDSRSNKGWFGGWFGGKAGDSKAPQKSDDKGSSSKPETKRSKPTSERSSGGERETGGV